MSKRGRTANTTVPGDESVRGMLERVEHDGRRQDCLALLSWFEAHTRLEPRLWGGSMVGFGRYHYRYDSGREGDWFMTGFAPRKSSLSIYIMPGYQDLQEPLSRLGKHRAGKSCLTVNRLHDIDLDVLGEMVTASLETLQQRYETYPC